MEPTTPVRPAGTDRVEGPGQRRRDGRPPGQRRGQARPKPAADEAVPVEEPDVGLEPPHAGRLDVVV